MEEFMVAPEPERLQDSYQDTQINPDFIRPRRTHATKIQASMVYICESDSDIYEGNSSFNDEANDLHFVSEQFEQEALRPEGSLASQSEQE